MNRQEVKEKTQHSTALVPYSCYECRMPEEILQVPIHWHSEFEINRVLEGSGDFVCDNGRFSASAGDLLIIAPNMLHAAYPRGQSRFCYDAFVFHPAMLGSNSNDRCTRECINPFISGSKKIVMPITPLAECYQKLKKATDNIFSYAQSNSADYDLLMKAELLQLFWLVNQTKNNLWVKNTSVGDSEVIRPALEFMTENYQNNITVEQLADLVHLSKSYFMNCFKKISGMSAIEYLIQLRMNTACHQLLDTEENIADIALSCGYSNLSNFNRHFKKIVGCAPREFRRNKEELVPKGKETELYNPREKG